MDLQLIVLAGGKQGTRIPLKKSKFVIGRASECTLRAGSEAVSRRHCAILRSETGWTVRDLGSRNGTFLNETKLEGETALKAGDELAVGPLKFRVEETQFKDKPQPEEAKQPEAKSTEAKPGPQTVKPAKQPPVKDVADVVQRTAAKNNDSATEEDISRWLLGISEGDDSLKETRTISMQETGALAKAAQKKSEPAQSPADSDAAAPEEQVEGDASENGAAADSEEAKSGSWNWLKFGKGKDKKSPGKLPKRAGEQSKDSREAAADILREMTRRH
jgi:pSer/pThr/pTyr-binding forkhead associated (FHA) protein